MSKEEIAALEEAIDFDIVVHPKERDTMFQLRKAAQKYLKIMKVVNEQIEDEGLWFHARTASEAYLQQELRRLHETVEGKTRKQCAMEAIQAYEEEKTNN